MELCQGQVYEVLQRLPLRFPCQGLAGSCFWLVKHVGVSGLASVPNSLIFQRIRITRLFYLHILITLEAHQLSPVVWLLYPLDFLGKPN